ncbi:MAG: hypothetical protein H7066_15730 [Cytophagaceae bacterium]|nr:hypothetical protein [Gemmatimonadaceae bacterium]
MLGACALALVAPGSVGAAQAAPPAKTQAPWTTPRTPEGRPDLQGNWTNATLTPIERPRGLPKVLSKEQVAALEKVRSDSMEKAGQKSDPNRTAPPVGGDGSTGAAGNVGGYNYFWIDAGDRVATVHGEFRSSLIVDPEDGRLPPVTPAARAWATRRGAAMRGIGQYDNPENRPLAERCIMSFGSNAGPPMLPNYFYNNNYTIVQTPDHVMIMTEMVHDVRIIRMGEAAPLPAALRPWMGDSRGRWEGDTLVIETTNFHPMQTLSQNIGLYGAWGATDSLAVTERLHRAEANMILYRFTVRDPVNFTRPWGGEVPFIAMPEQIYEYACHEGNYALSNVLSGARAQEREAAKKPAARPKPR